MGGENGKWVPKFFGQFLLEKGAITREQLIDALEYQQSRVLKLGEIAVQQGYLTPEQVKFINEEQKRTDKLFGELAVELGYLTQEQLEKLITIQKNNHIFLGQILVDKGYISGQELSKYLEEFHKLQRPIENLKDLIPEQHEHFDAIQIILDMTIKLFRRMPHILVKLGKGYYYSSMKNSFMITYVDFTGSYDFKYFFNLPKDLAYEIAQKLYRNESIEYSDELVADFVGELANVISGNITSQLLELGLNITIHPPVTVFATEIASYSPPPDHRILAFPARVPSSDFTVGIIEKIPPEERIVIPSKRIRVLVADDSALVRIQLKDILSEIPEVELVGTAKDGDEAFKLAEIHHPDLVILDLVMPGRSSSELLEYFINHSIDVVVLSGLGNTPQIIEDSFRKGVKSVVAKPLEPQEVKKIITQIAKEKLG